VPLSAVLRRCKVLAARLGSDVLEDWIEHELNGYPDDGTVPDYRVADTEVVGYFTGAFGRAMENAPVPRVCIPETIRERATTLRFYQSVAEIEELLKRDPEGLRSPLPSNWIVLLGARVYQGMNCLSAWRPVSPATLKNILNVVRNKVLDLALRIEKLHPEAGEAIPHPASVSPKLSIKCSTQLFMEPPTWSEARRVPDYRLPRSPSVTARHCERSSSQPD
jgi:hypothetical protein